MSSRLDRMARAAPPVVAGLYLVVCVAAIWRVTATIFLHFPFDPNEGWNAYHAATAMSGQALYPPAQSYFVNNYPPLSFYVVGLLGHATGDMIVAGRLVSFLAFLAVVAGVWRAARIMDSGYLGAGIGALLFAATLLIGSDYVGMDDPQMLGHALEMGALLLVLRGRDWIAAFVFVAAIFVKHNLVAMPLAVALWLLVHDTRRGLRFAAGGAGFSLLGLAAFRLVYGSSLWTHLASARGYSFDLLASSVGTWLIWAAVPLLIFALLAALHGRERSASFVVIYAAIAIVVGIGFSGGAGVDANVFFDADIALALGVALAIGRLGSRDALWPAGLALSLLLPLFLGLVSDADWRDPGFWLHPMADEAARAQGDIAFLAAHKGPALCETLAYCYWAGKAAEVDVFNVGQEFATGTRRDAQLDCMLEGHAFGAIEFDSLNPFSLTPRLRTALLHAYRVDHVDDGGVFLVPR